MLSTDMPGDRSQNPAKRIVEVFGSQASLARAIGRKQSSVWNWTKAGFISSRSIPEIIEAAARLDPPVLLRPDDFFDLPQPRPRQAQMLPEVRGQLEGRS
jgi:hypothetical protein